MKAETLKPFISTPSVTDYVGNRKRNVIVVGLSIFFFIIFTSLLGFTIWNSMRVAQLEKRIDSLNKFVDNMHKRLGLDYLDEISAFENNYANHDDLVDDPDDDDEEEHEDSEEQGQLLDKFDAPDYSDDKKGHFEKYPHHDDDDEEDHDSESGSGYNYDDDDDDDDDDYDDAEEDEDNGDKLFDDFEKFVGSKNRRTRSVPNDMTKEEKEHPAITQNEKKDNKKDLKKNGVELKLIFDEPNQPQSKVHPDDLKTSSADTKKSDASEHKKTKINKHLIKGGETSQLKSKDPHEYILYPYNSKKKIHHNLKKIHDVNSRHGTATTSSPHQPENSRISSNKNKKNLMKLKNVGDNIHQNRRYRNGKLYPHQYQERKGQNIIAAHFNLNRFNVPENSNKGNEGLLNHQRDFENTMYLPTISSWSSKNQPLVYQNNHHTHRIEENYVSESGTVGYQNQLPTVQNGIVIVQVPGIYYIYAQIYYHNNKDHNGYWIYHNTKPFLQCYITITDDKMEKGNTCYTSGVLYLSKGDTIHLKDMYKDHSAMLGTSKSFFGLVRLGDAEYHHYHHSR